MKKLHAGRVKTRFCNTIGILDSALKKANASPHADRKFLTESSLLAAAALWERFIHELFVTYVNKDSGLAEADRRRPGRDADRQLEDGDRDQRW